MATNFYLDSRTDKKGEAPIRVSIAFSGSRFVTSTGYKVEPAKWDKAKQVVKAKAVTAKMINSALSEVRSFFEAYETDCIRNQIQPTSDQLKEVFADNFGKGKNTATDDKTVTSLLELMNIYVAKRKKENTLSLAQAGGYNTLMGYLSNHKPALTIANVSADSLTAFSNYLISIGLRNSSIKIMIVHIKTVLRWAELNGYEVNQAYKQYKYTLKTIPPKPVFLEWDELMRVYNYEVPPTGTVVTLRDYNGTEYTKTVISHEAMENIRDMFCFCCFSSLRYSDVKNLKWGDVVNDRINITTIKTSDSLSIELNDYSKAILARRQGSHDFTDKVFCYYALNTAITYIRELCELCGINTPITKTYYKGAQRVDETQPKFAVLGTHTGRRTFICNALSMGIPAETVMKWTGHSDYKAMKPYIDISDKAKAEAMTKFNTHSEEITEETKRKKIKELLDTLSTDDIYKLLTQQ
jgi:integrase